MWLFGLLHPLLVVMSAFLPWHPVAPVRMPTPALQCVVLPAAFQPTPHRASDTPPAPGTQTISVTIPATTCNTPGFWTPGFGSPFSFWR